MVVVFGQGKVSDEVRVSSEARNWFTKVGADFGVRVELPDEDAFVSTGSDEYLSILILLLGMSSFDTGDPVRVTL